MSHSPRGSSRRAGVEFPESSDGAPTALKSASIDNFEDNPNPITTGNEDSVWDRVKVKMDKIVYDKYMGLDKDEAPWAYLYAFTITSYALAFGLFLYFFITSYITSRNQSFVSLDENSGVCETVSKAFSGLYFASFDGYWSGSTMYYAPNAVFSVTFNSISLKSNGEFRSFMDTYVYNDIFPTVGTLASKSTLASILMLWMNYANLITLEDQTHVFQFAGTPVAVFNVDSRYSSIGNVNKTCSAPVDVPVLSWNNFLAAARYQWDASEYACDDVLDPRYIGYNSDYDGTDFYYKLDHFSLTTAAASNFGLIPIESLNNITNIRTFEFRGANYSVDLMFDGRYWAMDAILCATKIGGNDTISKHPVDDYCFLFLRVNGYHAPVVPIFTEWGYEDANGDIQECSCPIKAGMEACNDFNFITGIITFPDAFNATSGELDEELAFTLAFDLVTRYSPYELRGLFHAPAQAILKQDDPGDFSFCDNRCSILAIQSQDVSGLTPINVQYGQVTNASCKDFTTDIEWEKLVSTPPGQLTEGYVNCVLDIFAALLQAGGVAMGNTQLGASIIFIVLFVIMHMFESVGLRITDDRKYSKFEYKMILEKFAHLLLDARNGRYVADGGNAENSPPVSSRSPTAKSRMMQLSKDMKDCDLQRARDEELEARGISPQMQKELQLFQFADSRTFHAKFDCPRDDDQELISDHIFDRMKRKMDDLVYDYYIGLDKENAPRRFLYAFCTLGLTTSFIIFAIFMYNSYQQQTTQSFLAAEQLDTANCQTLGIEFSGTYYASTDGAWSTASNYWPNHGLFQIVFSEIEFDDQDVFESYMDRHFLPLLQDVATGAANRTLTHNLLYSALYVGTITYNPSGSTDDADDGDGEGFLQFFQFTGSPADMFYSTFYVGMIGGNPNINADSNAAGYSNDRYCPYHGMVLYDRVDGIIEIGWERSELSKCINPYVLGYIGESESVYVTYKLDVTSLMSAVAVARNVIDYSYMGLVKHLSNVEFRGAMYSADLMINVNVAQMGPILCLNWLNGTDTTSNYPIDDIYCFMYITVGDVFVPAVPMFTEWGYQTEEDGAESWRTCTCPDTATKANCNEFQFITGMIVFPDAYQNGILNENYSYYAAMDLVTRYNDTELIAHYHDAAVSVLLGSNNANFSFCGGNCSMLAVRIEDASDDYSINPFAFQFKNASCKDTFSLGSNWSTLVSSAPVPLKEDYYRCTYKPFTAFINSAGIGSNIVQVGMPFILVGLFIVLTVIELSGYFPKSLEKYSAGETTDVLEKFAHMLLEGKHDQLQLHHMNSVVKEIAVEVKGHAIVRMETRN